MEQTVINFLQNIADKLGTTTSHILEVYSKQAYINSWVYISVTTLLFILFSWLAFFCYSNYKRVIASDDYSIRQSSDTWSCGGCLASFSSTVVLMVFATCSTEVFAGLFNPEYVAIHTLLSQLK